MTFQSYPIGNIQPWYHGLEPIPATNTVIYPQTTKVNTAILANTSTSDQTVTILDCSTNNGGQPCALLPTITVKANSLEVVNFASAVSNGGVQWVASAAGVVMGEVIGGRD
jgi:hypothetical protein